jgi:alkylglycerol monooxygenase
VSWFGVQKFANVDLLKLPWICQWFAVFYFICLFVSFFFFPHVFKKNLSGEDYNLATALRQGALQPLCGWPFYLPLALLGLPPKAFSAHAQLNTLYMFWIHTDLVYTSSKQDFIAHRTRTLLCYIIIIRFFCFVKWLCVFYPL